MEKNPLEDSDRTAEFETECQKAIRAVAAQKMEAALNGEIIILDTDELKALGAAEDDTITLEDVLDAR